MKNFFDIRIEGITEINKVVSVFEIWTTKNVPYGKFKVKILEKDKGNYIGVPNIAVKDKNDKSPDWICGLGSDVEEALKDTIIYFLRSLEDKENLREEDFVWAEPEDF